jgi:hypothetical protein
MRKKCVGQEQFARTRRGLRWDQRTMISPEVLKVKLRPRGESSTSSRLLGKNFPTSQLTPVIGGMHLFPATDEQLDWTADKIPLRRALQVTRGQCAIPSRTKNSKGAMSNMEQTSGEVFFVEASSPRSPRSWGSLVRCHSGISSYNRSCETLHHQNDERL